MRVLHFSDVHVQASIAGLSGGDWLSKRGVGAMNLLLRRGKFFREARAKLQALDQFRRAEGVELVICTGDYTALGTEAEHVLAREAVEPFTDAPRGMLTVPGNHDLYLADSLAEGRFERHFGDLVSSDWPDASVDGPYPWLRLIGEDLAVIGINSARPNPNPVRSSGVIPPAQLERLAELLADPRLAGRWVWVLTHYGLLRQDGKPDTAQHGLENADALAATCLAHPRCVVLHGHIHWRYFHPRTPSLPASFGAGSATYAQREGAWLYEVAPGRIRALPCGYDGEGFQVLPDGEVIVEPA